MPRMIDDPTRAACPSFEDADWDFLRQPLIDAHVGDAPLTVEEVTRRMKEAWVRENDRKIAAWNCYVRAERSTRLEWEGYDRVASHVGYEVSV